MHICVDVEKNSYHDILETMYRGWEVKKQIFDHHDSNSLNLS